MDQIHRPADADRHAIIFLRLSAIELRKIADALPRTEKFIADPLRHIADQCDREALELTGDAVPPLPST